MQLRGATVELVDPIKVFERDGWRCQLCMRKTPARLRGSYDPRAPELDHIVPISKGGAHSYINTQCACRECNGKKLDRPLGQLRLIA
jgi:5-methylcytosine-specific restriction endonuclease McrA